MVRFLRRLKSFFQLVLLLGLTALGANSAFAQSRDQLAPTLSSAHHGFTVFAPRGHRNGAPANSNSTRPVSAGIDSIKTFNGEFRAHLSKNVYMPEPRVDPDELELWMQTNRL